MVSENRFYSITLLLLVFAALGLQYPPLHIFQAANTTITTTTSTTSSTSTSSLNTTSTTSSTSIPTSASSSSTSTTATTSSTSTSSTMTTTIIYQNTTFSQIGLPKNTLWAVSYNAISQQSQTNSIMFNVSFGTYPFFANSILVSNVLYVPVPANTNIASGTNTLIKFLIKSTFSETGLPSNAPWSVVVNGNVMSSTKSSFSFYTLPGTYSFTIPNQTLNTSVYLPAISSGIMSAGNVTSVYFAKVALLNTTTTSLSTTTTIPALNANSTNLNQSIDSQLQTFTSSKKVLVDDLSNPVSRVPSYLEMSSLSSLNSSALANLTSSIRPLIGKNTSSGVVQVNSSTIVPYGLVKQSGKYVKAGDKLTFATYNKKHILTIYNVTIAKSTPKLTVSSAGVDFSEPNQTIIVHTPILPGQKTYNVSIALSSILNNTNNLNYTYRIDQIDINRHTTTPIIKTSTVTNALSKNINLQKLSPDQAIQVTFDAQGNANYTAVDPVVVIAPTNILFDIPIVLINPTSVNTVNPFQVRINVNSLAYQAYEANNLQNIEFFYGNSVIIPSWLEGNNFNSANIPTYSDTNDIYWLSVNTIPQNSIANEIVYMGFASSATNLFSNTITGEAPQITNPNYAQYDSGSVVFKNYWNFQGTSLPSGWTTSNSGANAILVANGLLVDANVVTVNSISVSGVNTIVEANPSITRLGNGGLFFGSDFHGLNSNALWMTFSNTVATDANNGLWFSFNTIAGAGKWSGTTKNAINSNVFVNAKISNMIIGVGIQGTANSVYFVNDLVSNTLASNVPSTVGNFYVEFKSIGGANAPIFYLNWTRVRSMPPNDLPPTVVFGAVNAPVRSGTQFGNVLFVSNTVIDFGQISVINAIVGGGLKGYTSNFFWIAPNVITSGAKTGNTVPFTIPNTLPANILLIFNAITTNTINLFEGPPTNTNLATNTLFTSTANNALGVWTINAFIIDSNGLGTNTLITVANTITLNPQLLVSAYSAIAVIGYATFTTNTLVAPTKNSLFAPEDPAFDSNGNLWVPDRQNNRVLEFPTPFSSNEGASIVLGQSSFTANTGAVSQTALLDPTAATFDPSGNLWVADDSNNRVLEYSSSNLVTGGSATIVLGQSSFSANLPAASQTGLFSPGGLAFDPSGNLWVADSGNNRILEYVQANLVTGGSASLVLGQSSFTQNSANQAITSASQNSLFSPQGLGFDFAGNLLVADSGNDRVLKYLTPFVSNQGAFIVIGQSSFTANTGATTQNQLLSPSSVNFDNANNLWVSEQQSNRVMMFSSPISTGQAASAVIGQNSFTSNVGATSQTNFINVNGFEFNNNGNFLAVADAANNRILTFYNSNPSIISTNYLIPGGNTEVLTASFSGGTSSYTYNYFVTNTINGNVIANQIFAGCTLATNTFAFSLPNSNNAIGFLDIILTVTDSATTPVSISTANVIDAGYLTTFTESGIPSGGTWNVVYAGLSGSSAVTMGTGAGPNIGAWTLTTPYPENIENEGCAQANGNLYCIGGVTKGGAPLTDVYFAPITGSNTVGAWSATSAYPSNIAYPSCEAYGGYIYCEDGFITGTTGYNGINYAKIQSDNSLSVGWLTGTFNYPETVGSQACNIYQNNNNNAIIYCVGGFNGVTLADVPDVYWAPIVSSTNNIGQWTSTNAYPYKIEGHSCPISGGYMYCVGGYNGLYTNTIYFSQILGTNALNTWTLTNALPYNGEYGQCTTDLGNIYCHTGYLGVRPWNALYYAPILSTNVIGAWSLSGNYFLNDTSLSCPLAPWQHNWYCIGGSTLFAATNTVYYAPLIFTSSSTIGTIISFITGFGNWAYTIASQVISSITYVPSPSSGNQYPGGGNNVAVTFSVSSGCQISLSNTAITFPSTGPGSGSAVGNAVSDTNAGGTAAYLYVYGSNWIGTSAANTFYVTNTLWNGASVGAGIGNALSLSAFGSNTAILLPGGSSNSVFFGVNVPVGQIADTSYTQNIAIFNVC